MKYFHIKCPPIQNPNFGQMKLKLILFEISHFSAPSSSSNNKSTLIRQHSLRQHRPSLVMLRRARVRTHNEEFGDRQENDENDAFFVDGRPLVLLASPVEEDEPCGDNNNPTKTSQATENEAGEDDTISMAEDEQPSVVRQNLLGPLSFDDLYYT